MNLLERIVEGGLWKSRYIVLTGVISSLVAAFAMFYIATVDTFYTVIHLGEYASPALDAAARAKMRAETVTHIVEIVDGYLLATVLLIFSLGLYELFISKIEEAESDKSASNVLFITSLDDLKARLAKVILMILIVKFFEYAIKMSYDTPLDLVYLSGGIALLGLALYLSHKGEQDQGKGVRRET